MIDPAAMQASVYTDFKGLNELRGQPADEEALRKVAHQFEALFTQMMLKQMRASLPKGGLFDSNQSEMYQEMFDKQVSLSLTQNSGMGLSELLVRQLGKNLPQGADASDTAAQSAPEQGGNNAPEALVKAEVNHHV